MILVRPISQGVLLVIAVFAALCSALTAALGDYAAFLSEKQNFSPSVYLINVAFLPRRLNVCEEVSKINM